MDMTRKEIGVLWRPAEEAIRAAFDQVQQYIFRSAICDNRKQRVATFLHRRCEIVIEMGLDEIELSLLSIEIKEARKPAVPQSDVCVSECRPVEE
jgi:hypothetical protein